MKISFLLIALISVCLNAHGQKLSSQTQLLGSEKQEYIRCLFFFIADCPASRNNMKPLMKLKAEFQDQGLKIEGVLSDPSPDHEKLLETIIEHQLMIPIQYDSTLSIASDYNVTTTPQFVLLNKSEKVVYTGAMDNYYYSFGKHRSQPSKLYLMDAIVATLQNKLPEISFTEPIGCKINYE